MKAQIPLTPEQKIDILARLVLELIPDTIERFDSGEENYEVIDRYVKGTFYDETNELNVKAVKWLKSLTP